MRAMVHSLVTTGAFEIYGVMQKDGVTTLEKRLGSTDELHGMLGFIDSIDVYNKKNTADKPSRDFSSKELVYRQFLIYSTFYAAPAPVVICEGDTDNVYLTHAIRSLAAEFPDLAETKDGKIRLKIRLYKYPHSSTGRILDLKDGGSGVLKNFIGTYRQQVNRFTAPGGLIHPVVILYDNDSGAKSIRGVIRSIANKPLTGVEPFVHVVKNLYALPTPLVGGAPESDIEDCFDAATKATVLEGKTFSNSNDIDPDKHYGKKVFAHRVVRLKADTIDFSGFRPLLTNLVAVINAHKAPVVPKPVGA